MGRPLTGRVEGIPNRDGSVVAWVARFSAYGSRRKLTIGHNPPWDEARARRELDWIIEQVKRATWVPPEHAPAAPVFSDRLTIGQLAVKYLAHRATQGKGTKAGQQQELLEAHVIPDWGARYPEDATPENVRRWVAAKVEHSKGLQELWTPGRRTLTDSEGRVLRGAGGKPLRRDRPYGPRRLNRAVNALFAVLDYGALFHDGPAVAEKLRKSDLLLKEPDPVKSHFTIGQVALVIEAAGQLDAEAHPGHRHVGRQALCATLLLGGFRIDEACQMRVGDVLRAARVMRVADAKTATGRREVNIVYGLSEYLFGHLDAYRAGALGSEPVFATRNGTPASPDNVREDVWYRALERAKALGVERGLTDNWPERGYPHVTRRTFITHLFELSEPVPYVQAQVGHSDSALTVEVYADVSSRRGPVPQLTHDLYGTDRTRRHDPLSEAA
jgi:integrase